MHRMHSDYFKGFSPPAAEPIFAVKSLVFLALNILTLGIYGTAETFSKKHQVKELKIGKECLLKQVDELLSQWSVLEEELTELLQQLSSLQQMTTDQTELKNRIQFISKQKEQLKNQKVHPHQGTFANLTEIALGTIAFVGQLMANLFTIGLYGVYQNYTLKNRINYRIKQNAYIQNKFNTEKELKAECIQKTIDLAESYIKAREELSAISKTDIGQAYVAVTEARQDNKDLKTQQFALQTQLIALQAQQVLIENEKQKINYELASVRNLLVDTEGRVLHESQNTWNAVKERDNVRKNLAQKNKEFKDLQDKQDKEIANLRAELQRVSLKAKHVQILEEEVYKLQTAARNQLDLVKKSKDLGPIAPKYHQRKEDGAIKGAMDIKGDEPLDPAIISYAQAYNKRYGDKRAAADVVRVSFDFALNELLDMAKQKDKIKITASGETGGTAGAHAVYRYMILDLIKGGKIHLPEACGSYALSINDNVLMYPSRPEKVIHYQGDQKNSDTVEIVLRYKQCDDFTPSADKLNFLHGVDVVSAKWILEQLSEEEKEHLFNLLMSPVIENEHFDYQKTRLFMQNMHAPRVVLVQQAYDLIADMAAAIQKKFGTNVLAQAWLDKADWEKDTFVKKEDEKVDLGQIVDIDLLQEAQPMEWLLDLQVLGDFADVLAWSQIKYKIAFKYMKTLQGLTEHPRAEKQIKNPQWKDINLQYYVSHQMIGSVDGLGGQRCLFSNLLAILVDNKVNLTIDNVLKLRKAMASFLDKIQNSKKVYLSLNKLQSTDLQKQTQKKEEIEIRKLTELADYFTSTIKERYGYDMAAYQAWLRDDKYDVAKINIDELTDLEIRLCAYTVGVKIGLLFINEHETFTANVNENGIIVPDRIYSEFFGPDTEEFLLLGINAKSYYGLFPKLNLFHPQALEINKEEYDNLVHLQNYWATLDMIKND